MKRSLSYLLAGTAMSASERAKGRYMRAEDGHAAPAPTPTPAPAPESAPAGHSAEFTDAFTAALAEDETGGTPTPTPAPQAEPAAPAGGETPTPTPAPAPAATPTPTPAPTATPTPTPAPAPAATPTPTPAPAAPTTDDILKGLTDAIKAGQTPPAATPTPTPEEAPIYSAEEQTQLTEYQNNWPDVHKAEQLLRRGEYHDLLKYVFTQMEGAIAPLREQVRSVGNTMHLGEVRALVPDYTENLEADVAAWVDQQPSYLQAGMKQVMQQGTSDEVADLIGRYRAATGMAAPAATPTPTPAPAAAGGTPAPTPTPAAPATELSDAAKQAVASLAPVSGERSSAPAGQDPADFQSAFARYAAEAEKD